jgi:hypothetical protein
MAIERRDLMVESSDGRLKVLTTLGTKEMAKGARHVTIESSFCYNS